MSVVDFNKKLERVFGVDFNLRKTVRGRDCCFLVQGNIILQSNLATANG